MPCILNKFYWEITIYILAVKIINILPKTFLNSVRLSIEQLCSDTEHVDLQMKSLKEYALEYCRAKLGK